MRIVLLITGSFGGAVVALWAARLSLTEWIIERALDRVGLGPATVHLSRLDTARAELQLSRSAIGTIDRIEVRYSLKHLLQAAVDQVTIDGAKLNVGWRDGQLVPVLKSRTPSTNAGLLPVAHIDIIASQVTLALKDVTIVTALAGTLTSSDHLEADLSVVAHSAQGHLNARISSRLTPDGGLASNVTVTDAEAHFGTVSISRLAGALKVESRAHRIDSIDAAFAFEQIASGSPALGRGRITANFHAPQNILALALDSQPMTLALRADASQLTTGAPFSIEGAASAGFLGKLAGASDTATGSVRFKVSGITPPAPLALGAAALGIDRWLRASKIAGDLNATFAGLNIPATVAVAKATGALHLQLANGVTMLTLPNDIVVSGIKWDKRIVGGGSIFADAAQLTVTAAEGAPLLAITLGAHTGAARIANALTLKTPRGWLRTTLAGSITFDEAPGSDAGQFDLEGTAAFALPTGQSLPASELTLDGNYVLDPSALRITSEHSALTLHDARWSSAFALPGITRTVLQPGATFTLNRVNHTLRANLNLQPLIWNAQLSRHDAEPVQVSLGATHIALSLDNLGPQGTLAKGSIAIPKRNLVVTGISGTYTTTAAATALNVRVENIRSIAEPILFTPLQADFTARTVRDTTNFVARLNDPTKRLSITAVGTHRLATQQGSATFTVQPIDFADAGTLQLLSPALAARWSASTGTVAGGGTLHWGDQAPPDSLSLNFKDVSLASGSVSTTLLNGALKLDSISPLKSAAGQRMTGILHWPTLAPVPLDVTFRFAPDALIVEHAVAEIFGGKLETTDATLDAATNTGRALLTISEVNLEAAFAVLGLEQLKGTGRIGGVLPLRIENARVAVDKGHLETSTPGTVQIGLGNFADQLKAYGQNVDLVFRALTDFHYDRLTIDATKPLQGAGNAAFRLEGNNPAVMAGHPFVFNINLESDFDKLSALLLQLSGAANTALGWGARGITPQ